MRRNLFDCMGKSEYRTLEIYGWNRRLTHYLVAWRNGKLFFGRTSDKLQVSYEFRSRIEWPLIELEKTNYLRRTKQLSRRIHARIYHLEYYSMCISIITSDKCANSLAWTFPFSGVSFWVACTDWKIWNERSTYDEKNLQDQVQFQGI